MDTNKHSYGPEPCFSCGKLHKTKTKIPIERRVCAAPDCVIIYECKISSGRKFCCRGHSRKKAIEPVEIRICECGCGEIFECEVRSNQRYLHAHANKLRHTSGTKGMTWEEIHGVEKAKKMREGVKIWAKTPEAKEKYKETRKKNGFILHGVACSCFICKAMRGETKGEGNSFYGRKHTEENKNLMGHRGSDHPNWQGGPPDPYPEGFDIKLKKLIRERDFYTCQLCGKEEVEEDRALSVHHIDYIKENINPNNLITLCRSCNVKVNYGRESWKKFFQKKLKLIS